MCYLPRNYDHNTFDLSTTMLRFHLANFLIFFLRGPQGPCRKYLREVNADAMGTIQFKNELAWL